MNLLGISSRVLRAQGGASVWTAKRLRPNPLASSQG
jgi:hypothetical protein